MLLVTIQKHITYSSAFVRYQQLQIIQVTHMYTLQQILMSTGQNDLNSCPQVQNNLYAIIICMSYMDIYAPCYDLVCMSARDICA